jgi:hypothetical protein
MPSKILLEFSAPDNSNLTSGQLLNHVVEKFRLLGRNQKSLNTARNFNSQVDKFSCVQLKGENLNKIAKDHCLFLVYVATFKTLDSTNGSVTFFDFQLDGHFISCQSLMHGAQIRAAPLYNFVESALLLHDRGILLNGKSVLSEMVPELTPPSVSTHHRRSLNVISISYDTIDESII